MSIRRLRLDSIIPPVRFRFDNAIITIYEVLKSQLVSGKTWYHVTLDIEYRGKRTRRFSLDCKDTNDFKKRLMVEVSKFKFLVLLGEGL